MSSGGEREAGPRRRDGTFSVGLQLCHSEGSAFLFVSNASDANSGLLIRSRLGEGLGQWQHEEMRLGGTT